MELARRRPGMAVKRAIDVVVSIVAVVVLAPVFLLVALAILVTSGRPIFFIQTRVGQHGSLFSMIKFRTMVVDAHDRRHEVAGSNERTGPLFKAANDPRVTPLGRVLRKTSIDELPQLFNVLVGTMSLVGPRPCLPEERRDFSPELLEREQCPQGMTGLWQLDGRHESEFGLYEKLDLEYVRNWSLTRDLVLLLRTPFVIVTHAAHRSSKMPVTTTPVPKVATTSVTTAPMPVASTPVTPVTKLAPSTTKRPESLAPLMAMDSRDHEIDWARHA